MEGALAGKSRPHALPTAAGENDPHLASWVCWGGCTCSLLGGKHQVQSEGPITPGSRVHQHSCLPPVGLDERHIEPQCPRVGLGWLTTSSLRVTGQASGAQPPPSVQKVRETRSARSSLRREQNPGQEGVGFSGAFRGNLVKKHRKII